MMTENNLEVLKFLKGYRDKENVLHIDFEIKGMTGEEEEAISKADIKNNGGKVIRTILERCILRIGTLDRKTLGMNKWREVIQNLSVGDQDYALLKIREESLGEEIELVHSCPNCKQELKTTLLTYEIEITPFSGEEEIEFELPKGYIDKDGNKNTVGKLRYPNGVDREVLDAVARNNIGIANTMMITRCMVEFENLTVYDDLIRKLSIRDRDYLLNLLNENQFGLVLETDVTCVSCGHVFKGNMSASNFM